MLDEAIADELFAALIATRRIGKKRSRDGSERPAYTSDRERITAKIERMPTVCVQNVKQMRSTAIRAILRTCGIDTTGLIEASEFRKTLDDVYDDPCPVCLDTFHQGETMSILSCKHRYHTACIEQWAQTEFERRKREEALISDDCRPRCPVCRKDCV